MSNQFKIGDRVKLKSGGPVLTVNRLATDGDVVEVIWFEGANIKNTWVSIDALEKAEKNTR